MPRKGSLKKGQKRRDLFIDQAPNESLVHYARRLAKTTDQRLVRLEAMSHEEHFQGVLQWAYKGAMYDLKRLGYEGNRFNREIPKEGAELTSAEERKLYAKINSMREFLSRPTSSKRGIIETYEKQAKTFNENNGTNFTWQELAEYFRSETYEKLDKTFGYRMTFELTKVINKSSKATIEKINAINEKHKLTRKDKKELEKLVKSVTKSKVQQTVIKEALKEKNVDLLELFRK